MEVSQGDASSAAVTNVTSDTHMRKLPGLTAAEGGGHRCTLSYGGPPPVPTQAPLSPLFFYSNPEDTLGSLARAAAGATKGMWLKIVLCHFQMKSDF